MSQPRVVVTQLVHGEITQLLSQYATVIGNESTEPWPSEVLLEHARDAEALMVFMPDCIDAAFLDQCPHLKVIAAALKGSDNFDVEACRRRGIWFTIVPDLLTEPTAELALALLLGLARNLRPGDERIRTGTFAGWRPTLYGASLIRSTVGLIGYGAVGQAFERLILGFGCRVIWNDSHPGGHTLDAVLAQSDFLVLMVPLTSETFHLINQESLGRMKRGAFLVNVGRGSVVDEEAVAEALESGHLAGYAADVFEMEDWVRPDRPRSIPDRLLRLSTRTLFTPHLGSATHATRLEIERMAAVNIIAALSGKRPPHAL